MKKCTKCGEEKEESEFYKEKSRKDGLQLHCKFCNKEYTVKNKEKIKEYKKEHRTLNKETIALKKRTYRQKNKQAIYNKHKDRMLYDPYYKFKVNFRKLVSFGFKSYSKNGKTKSCKEYGIDFKAIYDKIGSKPESNYHLDHIIPICKFDLDNSRHIILSHSPQNLRWITAEENLTKNDSIDIQLICESPELMLIAQEIGLI